MNRAFLIIRMTSLSREITDVKKDNPTLLYFDDKSQSFDMITPSEILNN